MTNVLLTGFGPFPGMPDNPSARLVQAIEEHDLPGVEMAILPTEWAVCDQVAARAGAANLTIMFGVAAGARRIRYERVAFPRASKGIDAAGAKALAPPHRFRQTVLPVFRLAAMARAMGFPVAVSHSAGAYICNASFGAALSQNPRALFVHIPEPSGVTISMHRLEAHALWLIHALTGKLRPAR